MLNDKLDHYIESLIPERCVLLQEMEQYAKVNHVPIMEQQGMEALLQLIRIAKPKMILEVGTAIGYSALRMAYTQPDCRIITIERDVERLALAKHFIERANKERQITMIAGDALELVELMKQYGPFDLIFIDAAKGQYRRFFEEYASMLQEDGMILTDNVLFKGLVCEEDIENKRTRSLVKKIDGYNRWLMGQEEYHTVILPVGDGMAISKKR